MPTIEVRPLVVVALTFVAVVGGVAVGVGVAVGAGGVGATANGAAGAADADASGGAQDPTGGGLSVGETGASPTGDAAAATDVDADETRMWIDLHADGDATWTVEYWIRLDDDDEEAAFETLARDVEDDPANYTERFGDRMRSTAEDAEEATDREMTVRNVTVSAGTQDVPTRYGVVTYTFEWTNFAEIDGNTIRAGDAIERLFLEEGTRFVIRWPETHALEDVRPSADENLSDDNRVGWAGAKDFGPGEPLVVVTADDSGPETLLLHPVGLVTLLVLLALSTATAFAWYRRRTLPLVGPNEGRGDVPSEGASTAATAENDAGGRTTSQAEEPFAGPSGEPPAELLSNEERVMRLVRERGGRIKQQEIVQEFDWTDAKTSQVVRDLREDGELEGFRLGRENVLRLPEEGDEA